MNLQMMKAVINNLTKLDLKSLVKNKRTKQIGSLYTSLALGIIVGVCVSIVNTRLLGPQQYGDLKFLQNLFTFGAICFTLGIFVSGGRLLAQKQNEKIKHQLIANLLILAALVSVVLIIGLFMLSFFEDDIFRNNLGKTIRIFSPLLFVFPLQFCLENIMQGDNRIYTLSVFRILPQILYIIGAIVLNYFIPLTLSSALALQLLLFTAVIIVMILLLRPRFYNIRKNVSMIWEENKTYGFQVYIGILASVASSKLSGLAIGYFTDNTNVGYFHLAFMTTMPLTMIPSAVGTAFFKDFANRNKIPKNPTIGTILVSVCALVIFLLVIKKMILLLYSKSYMETVPLAYIMAVGCVFHGFGDYINRFLGAHGKGKELRNGAFAVGIANVVGYTLLVSIYGVIGAAVTKVISDVVYYVMMQRYYRKSTIKLLKL